MSTPLLSPALVENTQATLSTHDMGSEEFKAFLDTLYDITEHAYVISIGLCLLKSNNILTEQYIETVFSAGPKAYSLTFCLIILQRHFILEGSGFHQQLLAIPDNLDHVLAGLVILHRHGIVTHNRVLLLIAADTNAKLLATGFYILFNSGLLTDGNCHLLFKAGPNAAHLAKSFRILHEKNKLTESNRDTVISAGAKAAAVAESIVTGKKISKMPAPTPPPQLRMK
jgi:transcriptional regulator GlxA family with amidase domain